MGILGFGLGVAGIVAFVVISWIFIGITVGWVLMLALGVLHGSVSASIPVLGYWTSVIAVITVGFVLNLFRVVMVGAK